MDEFNLIIEMEGAGQIIEIEYDKSSGYVFNTLYDDEGYPIRKEVKKMKHNPIPLIRDELERQIKFFSGKPIE